MVNKERKAIVFGATGKTGKEICKQLSAQNIDFTAFVRESSIEKLSDPNTLVAKGDVSSFDDVESAMKQGGFTDIVIALGSSALRGANIRFKGTENIIKALQSNDLTAKIHAISALGVGDSWKQLNWFNKLLSNILLKSVMNDHNLQETAITNSSFKFHIIRPVGLKDGNAKGKVHKQDAGYLPFNDISRTDVAQYLVDAMLENVESTSSICRAKEI